MKRTESRSISIRCCDVGFHSILLGKDDTAHARGYTRQFPPCSVKPFRREMSNCILLFITFYLGRKGLNMLPKLLFLSAFLWFPFMSQEKCQLFKIQAKADMLFSQFHFVFDLRAAGSSGFSSCKNILGPFDTYFERRSFISLGRQKKLYLV